MKPSNTWREERNHSLSPVFALLGLELTWSGWINSLASSLITSNNISLTPTYTHSNTLLGVHLLLKGVNVQFSNDLTTPCQCQFRSLLCSYPCFERRRFQSYLKDVRPCNSPTDVAFVLSHAEVSLHVVPGVSQLSSCKVADLAHEGLRSCKTKYGEFISNNIMFERKRWQF